jgi:hypothetical protein
MTGGPRDYEHEWYRDSELLDVSLVPLRELVSIEKTVLDDAIRRVLEDIDTASEAISS